MQLTSSGLAKATVVDHQVDQRQHFCRGRLARVPERGQRCREVARIRAAEETLALGRLGGE